MKQLLNLLTLVLIGLNLQAQVIEPIDYEQKLSYIEFETDYYLVNEKDIDNLSMLDKVKMKEMISQKEYRKFINENDERTTIIEHISTLNTYQDWMEVPEVLLIDKDGVSELTYRGKLVNRIEHSPTYLEMSKNLGSDLLPIFPIPNSDQKVMLQDMGYQVIDLVDGSTMIKSEYQEMIYNEEHLFLEERRLNENGKIIKRRKINFMTLPDGEIVYQRIRESNSVQLENDIVAEHVFLQLFSNYRYENVFSKKEQSDHAQKIKVVLDSDQNNATLNYKPFTQNSLSRISIFSMNGRLVKTVESDNNGRNNINVSDLEPGVYILRLESNGKTLSEKFVKL